MDFLKGFKTMIAGLGLAVAPAALHFITNIDPVAVFGLSPGAGAAIGLGMMFLRAITSTPVGQK